MNANTRSTLLIGATLALGLGGVVVATAAPPAPERVAVVNYSSTGDTATVTVGWSILPQAVGYLVEWQVDDLPPVSQYVDAPPASLRIVQHEVERTGTACVYAINRGGKASGAPQCEPFIVNPSYPLIDAPEDVVVDVEHAPTIQWDSLRVSPGVIAFESLQDTVTTYVYAYHEGEPFACSRLSDGILGWVSVARIREDGSPEFAATFRYMEDACATGIRKAGESAQIDIIDQGMQVPGFIIPAPGSGA